MQTLQMDETKQNTENNGSTDCKKYDAVKHQIIASISWFLVTLCCGMSFAFTGTLLPLIKNYINGEQGSWLVATNVSSMVIGVSLSTTFTRAIGNKYSILISNTIWIFGWICLSSADHFYFFILGCFLIGFSTGFGNKIAIFYLIEMPQRELRGIISVFNSTCFATGQMLGHLATIVLPWRKGIQMCAIVPLMAILFLKFVPELPSYLLSKDKLEQAERNFFLLRGVSQESEREFSSMVSRRKDIAEGRKVPTLKIILTRRFLIPFFVSATLLTTQSTSGFDCLIIYTVDMLKNISSKINAEFVTILLDSLCVIFGVVSCYLVKKFRRRVLALTGTAATIVSLILLISSMHFGLPVYVLITFLCVFNAAVNLGLIPVVWLIPAEIFPEVIRDLGISCATTYYYLFTALTTKFLPRLMETYGMEATLGIFTAAFCVCTVLLFFILPETKKLTLQELENKVHKMEFGHSRIKRSEGIETGS